MILVVLSTHAELASATARGRSYWETGELMRNKRRREERGGREIYLLTFDK